jgi:hypothetical protein
MNLAKLGSSSWIIFLNIILLLVLIMQISLNRRESFVNYPQQINPMATPISNSDATNANNSYASILLFLQKNPSESGKFIADIKQKLFSDSCTVRDNIDFPNIAKMPNGMPFS